MGKIEFSNEEVSRNYGFLQRELMDQNMNIMIPSLWSRVHDQYVMQNMESQPSRNVINSHRLVFALNRNGHLVHSVILIRVLPKLGQKVNFLAFIRPTENIRLNYYIIYDKNSR